MAGMRGSDSEQHASDEHWQGNNEYQDEHSGHLNEHSGHQKEHDDHWGERSECRNKHDDRWDERGDTASDDGWHQRPADGGDGGLTLLPQPAGRWAIVLAISAALIAGLGGLYWNAVSRQASADEAARGAITRPTTANPPAASSQPTDTDQPSGAPADQSAAAALPEEIPMSGRNPIGPDGKLLKPIDTPAATPPHKPANMEFDSKEGMEAFTQYVVDSIEYMWASNDTSTFEALSDPNCEWCRGVTKLTTDFAANGGWALDAKLTIVESSVPFQPSNIPDAWRISVKLELSDRVSYNGVSVEEKPGQFMSFGLIGQHKDGKWVLLGGRNE